MSKKWYETYNDLRGLYNHLKQNSGKMSEYEREQYSASISQRVPLMVAEIERGAVAHLQAYIDRFKKACDVYDSAEAAHFQHWDAQRLNSEMHIMQKSIDRMDTPAKLANWYKQVMQSGDDHQQRAASELVAGVKPRFSGFGNTDKMEINRLAIQAAQELERLQVSDKMLLAADVRDKAGSDLKEAREYVRGVNQGLESTARNHTTGAISAELTKVRITSRFGEGEGDVLGGGGFPKLVERIEVVDNPTEGLGVGHQEAHKAFGASTL